MILLMLLLTELPQVDFVLVDSVLHIDRLMMILEKKASIREVMAFPKTGSSEDLLFNAPSILSDKKVEEMNVKIIRK